MVNVIKRITGSKDFLSMTQGARLLFYDILTHGSEDRTFSNTFLDGILSFTGSKREYFNELYDERFIIIDRHGNYKINKFRDAGNILNIPANDKIPESADEIADYCREIINYDYSDEGTYRYSERFYNYYLANGWKLSNGKPIKDLKALLRQWLMRDELYFEVDNSAWKMDKEIERKEIRERRERENK